MTDWTNAPFIDYWNAVEDLLQEQYGLSVEDSTSGELVAGAQEELFTPREYVDYIANKYELEPLSMIQLPYTRKI